MRYALPAILVAGIATYGCVAPRERGEPAPPPPASVPAPRPAPAAPPVEAAAPPVGWADLPDTPGAWLYEGEAERTTTASFFPGAVNASEPLFSIRCQPESRRIYLARLGTAVMSQARRLDVRTTSLTRSVTTLRGTGGPEGALAEIAADDPILDAIAFSRGHFTVEAAGATRLVLPAAPEVARVVEDCRA